jgi:hypothetical protein
MDKRPAVIELAVEDALDEKDRRRRVEFCKDEAESE